jgi:hypothetical protein
MSKEKSSFGQSDIVRLSDEDAAVELLERAVTGLGDVVNDLTRFRRTTRQNYRVTIFGSARLKRATTVYNGVKKLAAELTKMRCDIIRTGLAVRAGAVGTLTCSTRGKCSITGGRFQNRRSSGLDSGSEQPWTSNSTSGASQSALSHPEPVPNRSTHPCRGTLPHPRCCRSDLKIRRRVRKARPFEHC